MIIDIILIVLLIMAIIKGYSRGLIVGIFSLLAIFIGLAAAMKLSVVVSDWLLTNTHIDKKWLPFLSFILVMLVIILLVRWAASLLQTAVEHLMLGWINRIGGILLYSILYITVFSVALFYLTQMNIIKPETTTSSRFYRFIQPVGPVAINTFARLIPFFKDMFARLEDFFATVAQKTQ